MLSRQWTTKVLIKLCGCAGWSVPLLFAYDIRQVFSWQCSILIPSTGASHYGICDIEALIKDTQSSHKFESKYDQTLIAPYDEEHMHVFRERSPIHYMDQMSGALAIFQGDEDKVIILHKPSLADPEGFWWEGRQGISIDFPLCEPHFEFKLLSCHDEFQEKFCDQILPHTSPLSKF